MNHVKKSILGLNKSSLVNELNLPRNQEYRATQILKALYNGGLSDFTSDDAHWNVVPLQLRRLVAQKYVLGHSRIVNKQVSIDGTVKWLLELSPALSDSNKIRKSGEIEMVYIPELDSGRGTLCVSSQIGCALKCAFCKTGTQAFTANLLASDIVEQVSLAQRQVGGGFPIVPEKHRKLLSNIVFMGQGEPLLNFENLAVAIPLIADELGFSRKKILVSTSGIAPRIPLLAPLGVRLAVSLHAPNDTLRDVLVPINKTYPLQVLKESISDYVKLRRQDSKSLKQSKISFEYVMLSDINDNLACAKDLVSFLRPFREVAHVNLIPLNIWPGTSFVTSSTAAIKTFRTFIESKLPDVKVTERVQRGADISAACGQLKT